MGRWLVGTNKFSYKYVFADQDANLRDLAALSKVGTGGVEPLLSASMDELERTDDFSVMELLRESVRRTGKAGGETSAVLSRGNLIQPRSFEFIMYALAESIVGVAGALDEKLEAAAQNVNLCGRAAYELRRADHDALLAWINGFLKKKLTKKALAGDVDAIAKQLQRVEEYLPFMALYILRHAVVNDLDVMTVAESQPETTTDDYWANASREWGPTTVFSRDTVPTDPDALFARALVMLWRGDRDEARTLLRACHDGGDGRAHRWLVAAGGTKVKKLAKPVAPKREDHTAVLEGIFAVHDVSSEWPSGSDPLVLDRILARKPLGLDQLRQVVRWRKHELADLKKLKPIKNAMLRGLLEEVLAEAAERARLLDTPEAALSRAVGANDSKAASKALVGIRKAGTIEDWAAGAVLTLTIDHGTKKELQFAYDVVRELVPLEKRTTYHVAYNLACAAAKLGNKAEMLACLRAAKLDGDHPRDALTDNDTAAYHDDPDLEKLAAEP